MQLHLNRLKFACCQYANHFNFPEMIEMITNDQIETYLIISKKREKIYAQTLSSCDITFCQKPPVSSRNEDN